MASQVFINLKSDVFSNFELELKEIIDAVRIETSLNNGELYSENKESWLSLSSKIESVSDLLADLDARILSTMP